MILKALAEYYERLLSDPNCKIAPPGFEKKAIPFLIVINRDGKFLNIRDTRRGEGRKKKAREFIVPKGEKKTSGIKANLLWDNPQYVLKHPKGTKERDIKKASDSFDAFKNRLAEVQAACPSDERLAAVMKFLKAEDFETVHKHEYWPEIVEKNENMTFLLEHGQTEELVAQSDVVRNYIESALTSEDADKQVCAVTGQRDMPSILHTAIKGVWGAQTSGANIVSFNNDAYCSYGRSHKDQGLNAPVGGRTEFAYTTALNTLLEKGSVQRMQVGDASTVFWAKDPHDFEQEFSCFLSDPPKGEEAVSYEKIRNLLSAVKSGALPQEDALPFYVLGLSPNASRIAVRFWYDGTVRELKENIARHYEDMAMIKTPRDPQYFSLFKLLCSTALESKIDNAPPNLGGQVTRSILLGTAYPRTLLAHAVLRCKAEQKVTSARASLIKGVLAREARLKKNKTTEVSMALDMENTNIGYVLGRLFAVLERIQEQAQSGLNKTIRDTYFSAACSSPLVTFKRLQDLAIHHLAKMRNAGKNTVWLDKLMQDVMDKVPSAGLPATLCLDDQGRFAVGYFHQRQDFFTKKNNEKEGDE